MRIGVDLMGSDTSPSVLIKGIEIARTHLDSDISFSIYITKDYVDFFSKENISFVEVSDFIEMDEPPLLAVRRKKESSLIRMLCDLKEGKIDAAISSGSTGALMAASTLFLPRLPGISRPGLMAVLPSGNEGIAVVDVGGFVEPRVEHLTCFARLGAAYQKVMKQKKGPIRIGLLNIGSEKLKGTVQVQRTYTALQNLQHSEKVLFVGNVEGRAVFDQEIDVLVTDGFTGNIFLKTVEGVSEYLFDRLRALFCDSEKAASTLKQFAHSMRYDAYSGALVTGIDGLVVKCHGHSTPKALASGIVGTVQLYRSQVIARMKEFL